MGLWVGGGPFNQDIHLQGVCFRPVLVEGPQMGLCRILSAMQNTWGYGEYLAQLQGETQGEFSVLFYSMVGVTKRCILVNSPCLSCRETIKQ